MKTTPAALLLSLGIALALASCGGSGADASSQAPVTGMKVQMADPNKWPKNDRSMCDWRGKPDVEVTETAGPGALKPNVRRVYKTYGGAGEVRHKEIVCREIDTNLDGIKDVVRTYNMKGEPVHEEADTNYDGKIDTWVSFVDGRMSEEDLDSNYDGKIDVWKLYVDGDLNRVRRDTNGDGKPDVWEIYVKGKLDRVGVDTEFDGHVDRWDRDVVALHAADEIENKTKAAMARAATDAGVDNGPLPDAGAPKQPKKAARTKKAYMPLTDLTPDSGA